MLRITLGLLDGSFRRPASRTSSASSPRLSIARFSDQAFRTSNLPWTEEQKTAVSGFATWKTVERWNGNFSPGWVLPSKCNPSIPKTLVYDPASNSKGARCGIYDNQVNAFGKDPSTGFARRALDNVGVQYGLNAFNEGRITADQFLDLNERIGGYDPDGKIVPNEPQPTRRRSASLIRLVVLIPAAGA